LIDLVFTALDSPYSVEILRGVMSSPMDVVVSSTPDPFNSRPWPVDSPPPDGPGHHHRFEVTPLHQRMLDHAHVPNVLIDPAAKLPEPNVATVGATNWASGLSAARQLLGLGHRRIAVIGVDRSRCCAAAPASTGTAPHWSPRASSLTRL
jgi:LacI family transcriptional regulator